MASTIRRFTHYPQIFIDPKRAWGNPTLGKSKIKVFKVWEMVINSSMEKLLEEEPELTLAEINKIMEFVDWCISLGLMEQRDGRLTYDKDALYQASELPEPPRGRLCLYCSGFVPRCSPAWTAVTDRPSDSHEGVEGVAHGSCVEATLQGEPTPRANVLT